MLCYLTLHHITSHHIISYIILYYIIYYIILYYIISYYIILYYSIIVLQVPTVFSTVTCCTGLKPRSNRLYHIAYVCSRLYYLDLCKHVRTTMKPSNDALLRMYPRR